MAGADGLDVIRALVEQAPAGTRLALEHGAEQGDAVRALLAGGPNPPPTWPATSA